MKKFVSLKLAKKSNLARTDEVSVELSRVRQERKGDIETKYEVLYTLGKGSYGEVQKIRDLETKEMKAVKYIDKKKCKTVEKYNDEIEILKKLVTLPLSVGSSKCIEVV
jgi:serine/threonine protein kinase